jgi:hypothetical protein
MTPARHSKGYDIRAVDQFYAHCRAAAAAAAHRGALRRSWRAARRYAWILVFASGFFCYWLIERFYLAIFLP